MYRLLLEWNKNEFQLYFHLGKPGQMMIYLFSYPNLYQYKFNSRTINTIGRKQHKVEGAWKNEIGGGEGEFPGHYPQSLSIFPCFLYFALPPILSECLELAILIFTCLPSLILTRKRGRNTRVHLMVWTGSWASLKMMYIIMSRNVSWKKKIVSVRSQFLHAWKWLVILTHKKIAIACGSHAIPLSMQYLQ